LAAVDQLDMLSPARRGEPDDGSYTERFDLPMPGISMIELVPRADHGES